MYISFYFKIIGDRKKKNGTFEFGARFYIPAKKRNAFRKSDEWWFVMAEEIAQKLNEPRVERISANRSLYYFDDYKTD